MSARGPSIGLILIFLIYTLSVSPGSLGNEIETFAYTSSIFLAVVLVLIALLQYFQRGLIGLLSSTTLVITSVIYWLLLDLIQGRYALDGVSNESIVTGFICIGLFVLTVILTSNFTFNIPVQVLKSSVIVLPRKLLLTLIITCFFIGVFYFFKSSYYDIGYMMRSLTKSRFSAPWARGAAGGMTAILEHLKYFGYILPSLTALLISRYGLKTPGSFIAIFLTIFFSAFEFQGGGRRIIGFLAGSFMVTYMIANIRRLKIWHFAVVGVLGIALLILLDMQLTFRNVGYEGMFEKYDVEQFEEIKVDDNFLRLAQIIDLIPSQFSHSGFEYLLWSFTRPIPRALWPNKPLGPGFDVAEMVGARGVSLTSTVIGESYASLGFVMIIIVGTIFGVLSGTLDRLLTVELGSLGVAYYSIGALALVAGVRSLVDLIIFSYAFGGLFLIYRFWLKNKV